ncbi:oxysterol-binding protein-related protein 10-like [Triplophysa rosa]|uniref:oxysterol-binding protein-related protein 10-like n=1 Tax=Triplophysa rosa TaxID=992332 RepID=UPI002546087A|nr:oxysterol-binding protein-related protein 10-like [Triplophysa rosa]
MEKTQERRVAARTGSASLGSPGPGCAPVGKSASPRPGRKRVIEGVLSKYTNLIQGWQNRYFVLDPELGQLQYFVNEQGRSQKPRGSLPLIGACVTSSDEAPHMFIVSSANRELFKLRAVDATEQHVWMTQIQACSRRHSDSSAKNDSLEGISVSDEEIDAEDNVEEDLDVLEDQRSVILQLCSQLKLGMDLTRVVLPTFILEKRSLLEMYANFMAHPDLFLAISTGSGPKERMVRFLEYYLTAFHEGRRGAVTKKPYNPVLGETFHCSWEVPRDQIRPLRSQTHPVGSAGRETNARSDREAVRAGPDCYRVRFVAEQVSHHPPVSGFYCECADGGMCVNTHVWTKSKFMGMSVGVSMVGEGLLYLRDHGEEYVFTFPSAYARSILTVPWVELGGKVTISCVQTGYSANVTFHTKPFYGGKVHRVTAEVKQNSSGIIVCKAQGEWNGTLEFTYSSGETKVIDTSKLTVIRKLIRPVEKQGRTESRRLWQHVTRALKEGNIDLAAEHKHVLEEHQRSEERRRTQNNMSWKPKYFSKEGDRWVYRNPLRKTLR